MDEDYNPRNELFRSSDEYKKLMELVEKLTPWDRKEFAFIMADKYLENSDMEEVYGLIDDSDYDPVAEVFNQDREDDVLTQMDTDKLLDYFYSNYLLEFSDSVKPYQLAAFINDSTSSKVESMLLYMKEQNPETYELIKQIIKTNES